MREKLVKLEKFLFYLLVLSFFVQKRLIWQSAGENFNEWTSIYLYASDILIVVLVFLWSRRRAKEVEWGNFFKAESLKKAEGALFVFLVIAGLSAIVSLNKTLSLYGFVKLLEMAALFLYVKGNFTKLFNLEKFWQFFVAGATLQGIVALIQFLTQKSLGLKFLAESPLASNLAGVAKITVAGQNFIRAYGLVPHPNILAAILIVAIFGLVYLWIGRKDRHAELGSASLRGGLISTSMRSRNKFGMTIKDSVIFVVIFFLLSTALFLTFSRTIIIVGLILLIWWLIRFCWDKEHKKAAAIVLITLFIVNCLLLTVYWSYFSSRFNWQNIGDSQSLNLRVFYNEVALNFIKESPLLGIGPANFIRAFQKSFSLAENWMYQPVHNIYLLIAAEIGILGLLAFLWFLFLTIIGSEVKMRDLFHFHRTNQFQAPLIKSNWPQRKDLTISCLLFVVCCLLFLGLFDHFLWDLQQGQIIFWLFLGLLASLTISPYGSTDRAQPSGG